MSGFDLNCDLGEGERPELTEVLCSLVTRINVACGGHAGDSASMRRCIDLASRHGLNLGAHPGLNETFGRGPVSLSPEAVAALVQAQVACLVDHLQGQESTRRKVVRLSHIKLHGSLYHYAEEHPAFASAFVNVLASHYPGVAAVGLPGRNVEAAARERGVCFLHEGFLDRAYQADGSLVPRSQPGAMIDSPEAVESRLNRWFRTGDLITLTGETLRVPVQTWCLHADGLNVIDLATAARSVWKRRESAD